MWDWKTGNENSRPISGVIKIITRENNSRGGRNSVEKYETWKKPWYDGFGAEFFKCFWKQLGLFVVGALNKAFKDGELSTTQKEGIIICHPKGDKARDNIKNWRPISLLMSYTKLDLPVSLTELREYYHH